MECAEATTSMDIAVCCCCAGLRIACIGNGCSALALKGHAAVPTSMLMKAAITPPVPASRAHLSVAFMLATLLERLEHNTVAVGAAQYRSIVSHLRAELAEVAGERELGLLLDRFPAAAELYENLNYEQASLCRSELEAATRAELDARAAIAQARRWR